jgi:hypothetical protein
VSLSIAVLDSTLTVPAPSLLIRISCTAGTFVKIRHLRCTTRDLKVMTKRPKARDPVERHSDGTEAAPLAQRLRQ